MNKKGSSIIELVVAMGIFMVVATIAVGAFVTVSRMKAMTNTMKESQQKLRIAVELVTRLSRQANKVTVTGTAPDTQTLNLYFAGTNPSATRFQLKTDVLTLSDGSSKNVYKLFMTDCTALSGLNCATWGQEIDLLGGTIYLDRTGGFAKKITESAPYLDIVFNGKITDMPQNPNNPYYNDTLSLKTSVILESLK